MKKIWIAEREKESVQYRLVEDVNGLFNNWKGAGNLRDSLDVRATGSNLDSISAPGNDLRDSLDDYSSTTTLEKQLPAPQDLLLDCSGAVSYANSTELQVIWANSEVYEQTTQAEKELLWSEAGLVVLPQLQDERLYIVRSINLIMLSMQRVNDQLEAIEEAIAIVRSDDDLIQYEEKYYHETTIRKIELIAARSLHCLQLDAGTVCIALSGTGTVAVRNVWTFADAKYKNDASAAANSLKRYLGSNSKKVDTPILIGADPEFILVDQKGKLIAASTYLSTAQDEAYGADIMMVKQRWTYPVAELRPRPCVFPDQLLIHLQRLMQKVSRQINDPSIRWLAGSMPKKGMALGGHIHLSGMICTSSLLRLLDWYVALPLRLIEDPKGKGRRPKYGALGDFRRQSYGGFEYRTLPSWLVSPTVANIALSLCWLVVTEHKQLLSLFRYNKATKDALESLQQTQRVKGLSTLLLDLRSLESSSQIEKALTVLEQSVRNRQSWDEQKDIRKSWSILNR